MLRQREEKAAAGLSGHSWLRRFPFRRPAPSPPGDCATRGVCTCVCADCASSPHPATRVGAQAWPPTDTPAARPTPAASAPMRRSALLLLAAAAAASAQAPPRPTPPPTASPVLATMQVRVIGKHVNASLQFSELVNDALALAVSWLSVGDLRREREVMIVPCNFADPPPVAPAKGRSAPPPPPPTTTKTRGRDPPPSPPHTRRLLDGVPVIPSPTSYKAVNGCSMMTLSYSIAPPVAPSATEFAEVPDAVHSGAVANEMALLGAPVDGIDLLELHVDDSMLSTTGGIAGGHPTAANGNNAARFKLRLIGPDATFGRQEMLRELLLAVAYNLTTSSTDYVSIANARIVKVAHIDRDPAGALPVKQESPSAADNDTATAAAPPPAARRSRALAQAPSPKPSSPFPRATFSGPLNLGLVENDPVLDVTMEINRLPPSGVRAVYGDVALLSDTNAFTRMLLIAGFSIDSARLAPTWDAFTVNGHAFDGGNSLMDRAILGDVAPLAVTIATPLAFLVAALITGAILWHRRERKRGLSFWGRPPRVESLAAVVAAARKGDTAGAAAMLLGDGALKGGSGNGVACGFDRLANDWQLDPSSIEIQRDASGAQVVLGAGAAGTVYRGLLNGVQDVAVKVFKEPLAALGSGLATRPSAGGTPTATAGPHTSNGHTIAKRGGIMPWWRTLGGIPKSDDIASGRAAALKPSPSTKDGAAADAAVARNGNPPPAPKSAAAARQLEELAREVVLMRACRDKNLVSFVGACVTRGTGHAIIVSELLPNGDLYTALGGDEGRRFGWARARCANGRPMPNTGLSRRIALDVARGLAYLHSRGVVHLDLKSPNILLSRAWEAKIADYGVSRVLRDRFVSTFPTAAGTLCWAAPEVLLGRPVNEKADIYSFGVVLWELSAREPPRGRCPRPLSVPEEAPAVVVDMIAKCMAEEPDERPTAAELVKFFKSMDDDGGGDGGATPTTNVGKYLRALSSSKGKSRREVGGDVVEPSQTPADAKPAAPVVPGGEFAAAAATEPARRPAVVPGAGFAAAAAPPAAPVPPPATHGASTAPPPRGPEV